MTKHLASISPPIITELTEHVMCAVGINPTYVRMYPWIRYIVQDSAGVWYGCNIKPVIGDLHRGIPNWGTVKAWVLPEGHESFETVYIGNGKTSKNWMTKVFSVPCGTSVNK